MRRKWKGNVEGKDERRANSKMKWHPWMASNGGDELPKWKEQVKAT